MNETETFQRLVVAYLERHHDTGTTMLLRLKPHGWNDGDAFDALLALEVTGQLEWDRERCRLARRSQ